ncbi:MAG: DUF393 domain-containing protein [Candidatus Sulfotelmatobacter sp.]
MAHPILLYDGVCGLCNRLNQFVLRRDPAGIFRFASLQSALAIRILARHGADAADLDTVYVVVNPDQPDETPLSSSSNNSAASGASWDSCCSSILGSSAIGDTA